MTDSGPLRQALETAIAEHGGSLGDLTVLAPQRDPFRLDTPAYHRDGRWLADTAADLGLGQRRIHLRGLHYAVIGRTKPNGLPYANTDDDWLWLSEKAAKAARWLGYIPFARITDQRNATPIIREFNQPEPGAYLSTELDVEIPYDLEPVLVTRDFRGVQPCRLVMIGEKSSLADVLGPVAERYQADLYLPTGEMSDTLVYRIAEAAAGDGRPLVVMYFADCDPAGHQMILSVTRKLQALKVLGEVPVQRSDAYGNTWPATLDLGTLDFQVHRVALTPAQVGEYGLPSTPLKDTEKRADAWRAAFGVDQTEIDALASLRPDLLRQLAAEALDQFYDHTLDGRVRQYEREWRDRAWHQIEATLDQDRLADIRADAQAQLEAMREQVRELSNALRIDVDPGDLPPIDLPDAAELDGDSAPLLDSRWPFADQCRALIASKRYQAGLPEAGSGRDA